MFVYTFTYSETVSSGQAGIVLNQITVFINIVDSRICRLTYIVPDLIGTCLYGAILNDDNNLLTLWQGRRMGTCTGKYAEESNPQHTTD